MAKLGYHFSEESKAKMRLAKLGRKLSVEHKEKIKQTLTGRIRSPQERAAISKGLKGRKVPWMTGENHWCWKGGITPEKKKRLHAPAWQEIRLKVYERDNWTCRTCGKHCKEDIQCNHIVPWRISRDDSMENLETLCKSCHMRYDVTYLYKERMGMYE